MATFSCNWTELRKIASDFLKAIPNSNLEELDAGHKCFNLHYLGFTGQNDLETHQAVILFNIVGKAYLQAEHAILQMLSS